MKIIPDDMIKQNGIKGIVTVDGEYYESRGEFTITPFLSSLGVIAGYYINKAGTRECCRSGVVERTVIFADKVIAVMLKPGGDADFIREA